jgi:hypothetical protein
MAFPLPPSFRKKLASASASASDEGAPNPMGVSESESDSPDMKGEKPNPLKAWAASKLTGR